jgi:hypothetical protein
VKTAPTTTAARANWIVVCTCIATNFSIELRCLAIGTAPYDGPEPAIGFVLNQFRNEEPDFFWQIFQKI